MQHPFAPAEGRAKDRQVVGNERWVLVHLVHRHVIAVPIYREPVVVPRLLDDLLRRPHITGVVHVHRFIDEGKKQEETCRGEEQRLSPRAFQGEWRCHRHSFNRLRPPDASRRVSVSAASVAATSARATRSGRRPLRPPGTWRMSGTRREGMVRRFPAAPREKLCP